MRVQITNLYTYAQANTLPLLGTNSLDFWADYVENYSIYDRYFRDTFLKFYYWMSFDDGTATATAYSDFVGAVQAHLYLNKKRYSELYRVQSLAENAYDIVNNYDVTETITRTNTGTVTDALGAQENSTTNSYGTETDVETSKVAAYDSSDFNNDSEITTEKGTRTDSITNNIGQKSNVRTDNLTETITNLKSGNIGVQTAAEIIGGHIDLWNRFNFFKMIFDNIAKEYLMVSDDYDTYFGSSSGSGSSSDTQAILDAISALSDKIDVAEANIRGDITEVTTDGY